MKTTLPLLLFVFVVVQPAFGADLNGTDDFNDNSKDPAKWGAAIALGTCSFAETNQRLQLSTAAVGTNNTVFWPWILNTASSSLDWEIIASVNNNATLGLTNDQSCDIGLAVVSSAAIGDYVYVGLYASTRRGPPLRRGFSSGLTTNTVDIAVADSHNLGVTGGAVRLLFDSQAKVITSYYAVGGNGGGYVWVKLGSFGVAGNNGETGNSNWDLSGPQPFIVGVYGAADNMNVASGTVSGDNFSAITGSNAPPVLQAQPAIISTIPAEMATGVPTIAPVVFTFSKTMNTSPTVTFARFTDSSLLPNNPSFLLPVTLSWSASNTVLTCTPNPAFPTNKTITWSVVGSDLAGNSLQTTNPAVLPGGFFTTGSVSEGTQAQPLILSMVPRNLGPLASPTALIVFTFNKPMNPSVIAPVFIDDSAPVPPFYGILPTLPVWSAGNTILTCAPIQGYPFPTNHMISWSVSGTDLLGHLLVGQAGVFAPRSGGPNTNETTSFTLTETCMYDQATAGATTLDPMATYVFGVTALVASNSPASSVSLTLPNNSVAELWGDSLTPKSFLWTEGITAPASFDATFPNGNYVFNLQGTTPIQRVTLNFPSGLIQPNAPHVNNFAAARAVNPALPFLLSWDPFQGAGTTDSVSVIIGDRPVFTTVPPGGGPGTLNGTSTSVLIPAGTFQPNGHYDATILFERFKVTDNSTNFTVLIRATITRFILTTTTTTTYVVSGVGVRTNRFGFTITGTSGLIFVVEACTNLADPIWSPLQTNTLTGGSSYFSDPRWTNYPARFYRLRSP